MSLRSVDGAARFDSPIDKTASADRPIGVFDSGVGGLSVLNALRDELPHERFVYFADTGHAPYGERGDAYVIERTRRVTRHLLDAYSIKALVVACNTATAAAIHLLRTGHPGLPLVGVEPALKPAVAASRTGVVGVLATRGTLESRKFQALHASLAGQAQFRLVPCDGLADAINAFDATKIEALSARYIRAAGPFGTETGQVDTVVLGCTHYPFVADLLQRHAGPAVRFIDTGAPVAQQTRRLLAAAGTLAAGPAGATSASDGGLLLLSSGAPDALDAAAARWMQRPAARAQAAAPAPLATAAA